MTNPYACVNTTDYTHPRDPNLNDLHNALQYNTNGEPVLRSHVDGITLEGDVIVDAVKLWDGHDTLEFEPPNNDNEIGQAALPAETYNMVYNRGTGLWDRLSGTAAAGAWVTVKNDRIAISKDTNENSNSNPIYTNVTNFPDFPTTIDVGNFPAFPASITANQGNATTGDAWKVNIGTNGSVALLTGSATIGKVDLNTGSNTIGKVDQASTSNPWVISGNSGANTAQNPIYTTGTLTGTANVAFPPGATSLLGELYSAVITPSNAVDALHGLNTEEMQTYIGGGGAVTTTNGVFECSITSTVGSYSVARTRHFNPFRPGESMIGRWLTKFDTPQTGTSQRIGLNNQEQGYYIGYNGTTFGILRVHGGQTPVYRVTITSYTGAQTVTLTLNSVPYTINVAAGETTGQVAQQICEANYGGAWLCNQRDNTVEFLYAGAPGPLGGTFSIAHSGTMVASVAMVTAGVAVTDTWYLDGGLDGFVKPTWLTPTNYCSYAIKYLWATTVFYAINFNTGQYEQIFRIGATADLPVENPTFKAATVVYNTGGSIPVTTKTAAMFTAVEGVEQLVSNTRSAAVTQSTLAQHVLHHIMSIQNPYTFNGEINTRQLNALDLTVSFQCNDPSQIYIYIDTPLSAGVHDFVSQDGRLATISTVTGTVADGTNYFPVLSFIVGTTGTTTQFNLLTYRFIIPPGSTMTLAAYSTASINKASASITWYNV